MPFYTRLRERTAEDQRTAAGLIRLKAALAEQVPKRTAGDSLLLATWNIREFESGMYGLRSIEPLYYIAEVISHFDLVAVQEVRDDLSSFNQVVGLLGSDWRYLLSDVTEGTSGNRERMAFLYDSRKVSFEGLAGELVLPKPRGGTVEQIARTPYIVGFQAGWFKFALCTVHIFYGDDKADDPRRVKEIKDVAAMIAKRAASDHPDARNTILLGDFNIFATTDATMEGITKAGFTIPEQVLAISTDLGKRHHYDQVAFLGPDVTGAATLTAGTVDLFDVLYREEDETTYRSSMGAAYAKKKTGASRTEKERRTYYRAWRTYQLSDHQPLWVEIPIDFSADYLARIAGEPPPTIAPSARPPAEPATLLV